MQRWAQYRTERVWTQQKQKLLRRGGKNNTEELYKKDLHDPDNNDGEITRLEPDILECRVKWALGSITMNKDGGGDRIPVELFQILKDDAVKVLCAQHASKFGKLSSGHRTGKCQFSFQPQERQCQRVPKLPHNCTHLSSVQSLSHVRLFATP